MQMTDDIALIQRYLAGEETAAEELVLRYQKQLYAFLYRMTRDMEEAKDLTQKTFLKAIQGSADFAGRFVQNLALPDCAEHRPEPCEGKPARDGRHR